MSQPQFRPGLFGDRLADLPDFVRARLTAGVVVPPAPGTAEAWSAIRRADALLAAEEAGQPVHRLGGSVLRRDGTPRRQRYVRGSKGLARALDARRDGQSDGRAA